MAHARSAETELFSFSRQRELAPAELWRPQAKISNFDLPQLFGLEQNQYGSRFPQRIPVVARNRLECSPNSPGSVGVHERKVNNSKMLAVPKRTVQMHIVVRIGPDSFLDRCNEIRKIGTKRAALASTRNYAVSHTPCARPQAKIEQHGLVLRKMPGYSHLFTSEKALRKCKRKRLHAQNKSFPVLLHTCQGAQAFSSQKSEHKSASFTSERLFTQF